MKVVCVYCANEGKPELISEKEPLDDPRMTHGVCAEHYDRLVMREELQQKIPSVPPRVRVP